MGFTNLTTNMVKALVEALTPRFIGRDQDHLLAFADLLVGDAYGLAVDYVAPLYAFRATILSNAGASSVGTSDGSSVQTKLDSLGTSIGGKEPAITAGTTAQYWRGDKTWQTLNTTNVPEGSNLYFTSGRAQSAMSGLYVDLTTAQTVAGNKNFTGATSAGSITIGSVATNTAGTIWSNSNWGMIFNPRISGAAGAFLWQNAALDTDIMKLTNTGNLTVAGTGTFGSILKVNGEIQTTAANSFRMVQGNYGAFWRNDGASVYLLFTASGDQYGSWNSLRPFYVNLASGSVTMESGLTVSGAAWFNGSGEVDISKTSGIKIRSSALGSGLSIGGSPTLADSTDPDVYIYQRNNGRIWWGTNNTIRGYFNAAGEIAWNHQISSIGIIGGVNFTPDNANVVRAGFLTSGSFGGGRVMVDGANYSAAYMTATDTRSYHIGLGTSAGTSPKLRVGTTTSDVNTGLNISARQFIVDGPNCTTPAGAVLGTYYMSGVVGDYGVMFAYNYSTSTYKGIRLDAASFAMTLNGASATGAYMDANGWYQYNGWFRVHGSNGFYFQDWGGGWYMTDSTYVRAYNSKWVAAVGFVSTSDAKLKNVQGPLKNRGRLNPVEFTWKSDGKQDFGFVAQEVQELYPEVVGQVGQEGDEDAHLSVDYSRLTAILAAQLYELQDKVTELEEKLRGLGIS